MTERSDEKTRQRSFKPNVIIHGGAGAVYRSNLPPELYQQYHHSLITYLRCTRKLLDSGSSALDAACYAVTRMEDDPLFNCGRGSVFTEKGTIEMEASVMVCSVNSSSPSEGSIKRGAAVSLIKNTRHPILLAKEVLIDPDDNKGLGGTSTMHCHLSGRDVEEWGWHKKGLEEKGDDWFWTKKRWDEHRRGLGLKPNVRSDAADSDLLEKEQFSDDRSSNFVHDDMELPSQGTVGAVCLDSQGNLAVATSTGGLTNKRAGRIGDTPTIGAGFWAECWNDELVDETISSIDHYHKQNTLADQVYQIPETLSSKLYTNLQSAFADCLSFQYEDSNYSKSQSCQDIMAMPIENRQYSILRASLDHKMDYSNPTVQTKTRAVAMSGTGNGDSFLRTNATRSAAAICRFSLSNISLAKAVRLIAGAGGELQKSAGARWTKTGEGEGGIIGIEVSASPDAQNLPRTQLSQGTVVFDFNCSALWRAYFQTDSKTGEEVPKVMVFKEEYFA